MTRFSYVLVCTGALAFPCLVGCNQHSATDSGTGAPTAGSEAEHGHDEGHEHAEEEHAHPSEGPHHGELVELGNGEYHAELVHNASSVTVYVLDSDGKAAVPIDAAELTINVKHNGKPEQFQLAAQPQDDDPQGKSSRFTSIEAELAGHLDEEGAEPKLVVVINGASYRGEIKHDHDHDHKHGPDDHDGHAH